MKALWRVWEGCLDGVGRLSRGCGEAELRCGETVWRVWEGCMEGVARMSGVCGEGCQETVGEAL